MSATMASAWPLSAQAPSTLAAGPDNTAPTGRRSARATLTSVPSPCTSISGASMRCRASVWRTASISAFTNETMRALSAAVNARRGAPRLEASSWPQVTGLSHSRSTHARNCSSCAGLRTPKLAEIANADTRGAWRSIAAQAMASSSGATANPPASCPPGKATMASAPSSSTRPLDLICAAS
jgi:hypothetical protein